MKIIAGAALLTLVASSAQAGPREEIYEYGGDATLRP